MQTGKKKGGARPGAGRKKGKSKKYITLTIDIDLAEQINNIKNKSQFINSAIREKLEKWGEGNLGCVFNNEKNKI